MSPCRTLLLLFLALALAACQGFDPAPYQNKPGFPGAGQGGQFGQALLKAANEQRVAQGYKALQWDQALADLAVAHATDMAKRGVADHAGFETRYKLSGFRLCVENVAQATGDPTTVVALWMNSPGHRANLLHPEVRWAGAARVGSYVAYMSCR